MTQPIVARVERRQLAMKAESTYGTDIIAGAPAAGDIVEAYNIQPEINLAVMDTPALAAVMGAAGLVPGARFGRITFEQRLRGAGAAYSSSVLPNFDMPLRAAGFGATVTTTVGQEKVVYKPISAAFESFSAYVIQENGPTLKLAGCCADGSLICQHGQAIALRVTLTGLVVGEAAVSLVSKVFSGTPQWPALLSSAFKIGAANYVAPHSQIQINFGNAIDYQEAPSDASGYVGAYIAQRKAGGTIDPEMVAAATFDWLTAWTAATRMAMSFQTDGAQYARVKVSLPAVQLRARPVGQRGQKAIYSVAFDALYSSSGNDEITLTAD